MRVLLKKSLRSLRSALGQYLALAAVVAAGVSGYYGTRASLDGLIASRDAVYRESRFADHYFDVLSAPESLAATLQKIPGIVDAVPRINLAVKIVSDHAARDAGRLISAADRSDSGINRVRVLEGRYFERGASVEPEAMVDRQYASAHGLRPGDRLEVYARGQRAVLHLVGICTSPEFLHKKNSSLEFPGWGALGILLTDSATAQGLFGAPGEVNQFLVRADPGFAPHEVVAQVSAVLGRYGLKDDYPRKDHPSHRYIQSQLTTLRLAITLLPPAVFAAALLMQAILLRRMIRAERRQIGILKALGYGSGAIILVYAIPPLLIGFTGALAGILGGCGLTALMSALFARAIDINITGNGLYPVLMLKTFAISMAVPLSAGLFSLREVTRIDPAASFRIELPSMQSRTLIERVLPFWNALSGGWKMSLRSVSRNPGRFLSVTLGIVICLGVLLVTLRFSDSRDAMLTRHFREEHRYDYLVKISSPMPKTAVAYWDRWPEVAAMECALEIPVKLFRTDATGAESEARAEVLAGLEPSATFRRVYDANRRVLAIPRDGIILSSLAADELGLAAGDGVVVEIREDGVPRRSVLRVHAISELNIGGHSIVSLEQASDLLGGRTLTNAVMLRAREVDFRALEERLVRISGISAILSQREQHQNAARLTEAITWFSKVMTLFALIFGGAIVYKNSLMAYIERRREIATLRLLGWTRGEIAALLLNDVVLAFAVGLMIGMPLSLKIGAFYLQALSTNTFLWPTILYPGTSLIAVAATGFFALVGHVLAVERVRKLDLLAVIKTQE